MISLFFLPVFLAGNLSMYHINDGNNSGRLACGGEFKRDSHHIAIRRWVGKCGQKVIVCANNKCVKTKIMDSGPWGAKCENGWRVITSYKMPEGCKRRGVVDLSEAVWKDLGKPSFLSRVKVYLLKS